MGQTRDLQKVGECLWLGIDEHLAHERRAALRQRERARQRADVLRRDAERFRRRKQRHDRRVAHGDLHDGDTRVIFEIAIDGRHIVAELVQFTDGIVNGMEVEVRGDVIGILVVCGVLHRAEIVDLFALWHDDHAARVLARGALDARAGNGKAFFLRAGKHAGALFGILFHVAERGFIRDGCDGAGLEDLGKGLRSQVGTMYGTLKKGPRYLEMAEGYVTGIALDKDNQIIGYKFVSLGKMTDFIKKGDDPTTAYEKACGQYGRVADAVKIIDPRTDEEVK